MILPKNFFEDTEKQLEHVLYSDTDSMYIHVPSIKPKTSEEAVQKANQVSTEINNIVSRFLETNLLPKMNINPSHNQTFFKNELTASAIIFLDVKKNYAYKITSKENIIYDKPKIKYTGIPIVRSDSSKFTRELIRYLIEEIALLDGLTKEIINQKLQDYGHLMFNKLKEEVENYKFHDLGIPCKWGGTDYVEESSSIIGMRLYNTITQSETFKRLVSGYRIPINIDDLKTFNNKIEPLKNKHENYIGNTPTSNLTFLTFPYSYDPDNIKNVLKDFKITIDPLKVWVSVITKPVERITETIKKSVGLK